MVCINVVSPYVVALAISTCVLLVGESHHAQNRAENFLLCERAVVAHVGEDGRLDEPNFYIPREKFEGLLRGNVACTS
nr:hypothetical protein [Gordonia oryzae]